MASLLWKGKKQISLALSRVFEEPREDEKANSLFSAIETGIVTLMNSLD